MCDVNTEQRRSGCVTPGRDQDFELDLHVALLNHDIVSVYHGWNRASSGHELYDAAGQGQTVPNVAVIGDAVVVAVCLTVIGYVVTVAIHGAIRASACTTVQHGDVACVEAAVAIAVQLALIRHAVAGLTLGLAVNARAACDIALVRDAVAVLV